MIFCDVKVFNRKLHLHHVDNTCMLAHGIMNLPQIALDFENEFMIVGLNITINKTRALRLLDHLLICMND